MRFMMLVRANPQTESGTLPSEEMLATMGGVERWCARGQALRLEARPSLVDAAREALELASPEACTYWLEQLERIGDVDVRRVMDRIPRMSDPQRSFAVKVLEVNRRRLLDVRA